MRITTLLLTAAFSTATLVAGCQDPLVSDQAGASVHVLPPGTTVSHVSSAPDLARQIRINDGLNDLALEDAGGVVALKKGWAAGAQVLYWDLGDASPNGALLYMLVTRTGEGETAVYTPTGHPYIADTIPGDPGYSPFWLLQYVVVTDRYRGEVLPSTQAIADAIDLDLVEEPIPAPFYMDGPIVPTGTALDMGMGQPTAGAIQAMARGYLVDMLAIGGNSALVPLAKAGRIPRGDSHKIWIGAAVTATREPLFQNTAAPWTPAVRVIDCHVSAPTDPMDPAQKIDDEAKLFVRDMMGTLMSATDRVDTWTITTATKNWPILVVAAP